MALSFSKDTKISILLSTVHAQRVVDSYAMRGAVLYALNKMSGNSETLTEASPQNEIGSKEVGEGDAITAAEPPRDDGRKPPGVTERTAGYSKSKEGDENKETVVWVPGREPYSVKVGNIDCAVYLHDENGKLNINGITNENRDMFIRFLGKKGIEVLDADVVVDSMLDWLDPDDLTHINGAEDKYYESLPEPYKAKDASFSSIEELMLVRDVTAEIFESIRDEITVYGEKQIKINVNFTSKEILSSLPGLTDGIAEDLISYIEESGPIKEVDDLREVFWSLGIIGDSFEKIRTYLTVEQSSFVTIRAVVRGSDQLSTRGDSSDDYGYRLIAGKGDMGYGIVAAFPE